MSVLVIADIGANHDGRRDQMSRAIEAAASIPVDCLKFQWTSDPERMAQRRGKAAEDGYAAIYRRYLYWPAEWHAELAAECRAAGIDYMCTVFLPEDVPVIAPHVRRFKIASFEAEDNDLIAAHQALKGSRDVIVSLGMGARQSLFIGGTSRRRAMALRCVSSYPAPIDALELASLWPHCGMCECDEFAMDGFSDHSAPELTLTGALAVAAGARVIEAHLRLPTTDAANPDYPHAMTPEQFRDYVANIRFAETCLGTGERGLQPCEQKMARYRVGA